MELKGGRIPFYYEERNGEVHTMKQQVSLKFLSLLLAALCLSLLFAGDLSYRPARGDEPYDHEHPSTIEMIALAQNALTGNPHGVKPEEMMYVATQFCAEKDLYLVELASICSSVLWTGRVVIAHDPVYVVDTSATMFHYSGITPEIALSIRRPEFENEYGTFKNIHPSGE